MKKLLIAIAILLLLPVTAQAARPGGETETGNNLSMPVIWSDGYALPLRGVYGAPVFTGEAWPADCALLGVECWYVQQDALNTWQAQSVIPASRVDVDWIDWGDNLESKPWYVTSIVRVEVGLWKDLTDPMTAFTMAYLWGQGPSEMWGTNATTYSSLAALVYSRCARLTIQKLTKDAADPTFSATWNATAGKWEGDVGSPLYNSGVWMTGTGRTGAYSAEINVSGKVVYGYNWNVRKTGSGAGTYRLTFSLDRTNPPVSLNTYFTEGITQIMPSAEEETVVAAEAASGGVAVIDYANNLTYIDVKILASRGRTSR